MIPQIIVSRRILACRDTLAAGLAVRVAGAHPIAPGEPDSIVNRAALPTGVAVMERSSLPQIVTPLVEDSLDALGDTAVTQAWRHGAWDLRVSMMPPLDGPELGVVLANKDWSLAPGLAARLVAAARNGRLVTWLWLPMRDGPAGRRKLHARKDASLGADGGRTGAPPAGLLQPRWDWRGAREWLIRLGRSSEAHRSRPRMATPRQRAYIIALLRQRGDRTEPPHTLTLEEASRWIDALRESHAAHR